MMSFAPRQRPTEDRFAITVERRLPSPAEDQPGLPYFSHPRMFLVRDWSKPES
jgi:hypothetical protein